MSVKTPNYILSEDVSIDRSIYDDKTLKAGTFVRPIEVQYVPKHVLENPRYAFVDQEKEVFCYTRYGIVPIPRKYIRET